MNLQTEDRDYRFLTGLALGGIVGAGLAMWLAPRAAAEIKARAAETAKTSATRCPIAIGTRGSASPMRSTGSPARGRGSATTPATRWSAPPRKSSGAHATSSTSRWTPRRRSASRPAGELRRT